MALKSQRKDLRRRLSKNSPENVALLLLVQSDLPLMMAAMALALV